MNNFDTVREALNTCAVWSDAAKDKNQKALTALAQIEADHFTSADMASAAADGFRDGVASVQGQEPFGYFRPEPFGWTDCAETDDGAIALYAAPVAQQPQKPVAWMVTTELQDGTCRTYPLSGRYKDVRDACDLGEPVPLYAAPVAQQPQANSLESGGIKTDQQPQAEAVPPDVVRDVAPIPDHELVTMYDERPTSDLEMIEFAREVERRHGIGVQPQHITDGSPCWCNPDVAYTDPETGASVILHRRPQ